MPTLTQVIEIQQHGRVNLTGGPTKNFFNIYHYELAFGTVDTYTQLGQDFYAKVVQQLMPLLSSQYTLYELAIRMLDRATEQFTVVPMNFPGGATGDRVASITSVTLPFKCVDRGKSFRGSKHFGPISDADQTGDQITPAIVPTWNTFATTLGGIFASVNGQYRPVIVSRKLSQLKQDPTNVVGSRVSSVLVNLTLGTMRRRKERTVR